jgi:hypothetical protein
VEGSVSCASCAAPNREERRFCGACGATLGAACSRCAFRNDTRDRYCGGCGAATAREARAVPVPRAAETAAAVLLSALDAKPPAVPLPQPEVSRPPPTRSTIAPLGGGLPALSATEIARLLAPRNPFEEGLAPAPQLSQEELDRLFGVT